MTKVLLPYLYNNTHVLLYYVCIISNNNLI